MKLLEQSFSRATQTAAERAIESLSRSDGPSARSEVDAVHETGFDGFADAVHVAASQLEDEGTLTATTWNLLADAAGSLRDMVEAYRTA